MNIEKCVREVFDQRKLSRTKSSIYSTIVFSGLIMFFMYVGSAMYNLTLESTWFIPAEISDAMQVKRNVPLLPLTSEQENSPMISPPNTTRKERIAWFQQKPHDLEIFRSNNISRKFHARVLEFFDDKCEVNFFQTWISPAELYGAREMMALESVFKSHPRGCLMILSPTMDTPEGYKIIKPLLDLGFKLLAATPNLPFLFKNTPAEHWFEELKSGKINPGRIPICQNLSNLLRLAVLYKYGGVYLDTDFIVLKSFRDLTNTIGAQSAKDGNWTRLNNAVLVFDRNHPLLHKFIEEFDATFNGNKWGHNGPYLVSRVARRVEGEAGYNFTIMSPMAFYPVTWTEIQRLFMIPKTEHDSNWIKTKLHSMREETYGLHLWNKMSRKFLIQNGSSIEELLSENCILCKHTQN